MNDRWIYKEIQPYVNQANKMQVGILIGIILNLVNLLYIKNQYYDWHCDSWDKPYAEDGPTKEK